MPSTSSRLKTAISKIGAHLRRRPWQSALAAVLVAVLILDQCLPPPITRSKAGVVVTASDGSALRSWPGQDGIWRHPVTPAQVSPYYLQALLAYEDRAFYWHPGVNPLALGRAALQYLQSGRIISGGSTLTMQVARIFDRPDERSALNKLRQILRALQLELRYSKREILTLYLNHAPMGGIVEGVAMASQAYLGKPANQLSQAEAALLVVLPQAPSRLRPDRLPEAAQRARDKVLQRMASQGIWTAEEVADARIERVSANPLRARWLAPLAAERLRQTRPQNTSRSTTPRGPQILASNIDRDMQATLERMLAARVGQLPPHVSMAALVMETDSLAVRAYAGSADFSDARRFNHVDMVRGIRSPGSTLKPFLYAMALDEGLIHSESLLVDAPQSFDGYDPGNFQANFSGPVSVAEALQRSLNVPAVDLLDRLGPDRLSANLLKGGLRLRLPSGATPNLSIILGGAGTNLEELVGAYRAFGAGGMAGTPRLRPSDKLQETRMMSAGAAFIVRNILENGGHPDRPFIEGNRSLAWKTGTSFGFRDAWAVGVTASYTIGVWVGRPDGTPNPGFFGANIAAPLLKELASTLPNRGSRTSRTAPASVSSTQICWPLGRAADLTPADQCHVKRSAWILNHSLPPTLPDRLRNSSAIETIWLDPVSGARSLPRCNPLAIAKEIALWPTQLEPWLSPAQRQAYGYVDWAADCQADQSLGRLRILGIHPGERLRPTPGQDSAKLRLRSVGATGRVYWLLDGKAVHSAELNKQNDPGAPGDHGDQSDGGFELSIQQIGSHRLSLIDSSGRHDSLSFSFQAAPQAQPRR